MIHLQMDNIATLSYIAEMGGGTNNKVLSDLTKELCDYLISEWDHDYSRLFTRSTQCGGRSSVTVSNGFQQKETEPAYFQKDLQSLWTPDIYLFASILSHQVSAYLAWKPSPFSKGTDVF